MKIYYMISEEMQRSTASKSKQRLVRDNFLVTPALYGLIVTVLRSS